MISSHLCMKRCCWRPPRWPSVLAVPTFLSSVSPSLPDSAPLIRLKPWTVDVCFISVPSGPHYGVKERHILLSCYAIISLFFQLPRYLKTHLGMLWFYMNICCTVPWYHTAPGGILRTCMTWYWGLYRGWDSGSSSLVLEFLLLTPAGSLEHQPELCSRLWSSPPAIQKWNLLKAAVWVLWRVENVTNVKFVHCNYKLWFKQHVKSNKGQ